jgi:hypothetical protein
MSENIKKLLSGPQMRLLGDFAGGMMILGILIVGLHLPILF